MLRHHTAIELDGPQHEENERCADERQKEPSPAAHTSSPAHRLSLLFFFEQARRAHLRRRATPEPAQRPARYARHHDRVAAPRSEEFRDRERELEEQQGDDRDGHIERAAQRSDLALERHDAVALRR
jgi:hypothetical protein